MSRDTNESTSPIAAFERLAYNLRWTWDRETRSIFRRLDPDGWRDARHNPVELLRRISPAALTTDPAVVAHMRHGERLLDDYIAGRSASSGARRIAYFSAEFAITECIRVFSGGLGVLAGDHLKSASDLALPLVGVGLLYRDGYFTQLADAEGRQREIYRHLEPTRLPLRGETTPQGGPLLVPLAFPGRTLHARVWRADVGTVPLYLLDTDVEENDRHDRHITDRLYGGDQEHRIKQEIVLGVGGVRALDTLGHRIEVFHLNEGHAAFAILERVGQVMRRAGISFEAALEQVRNEMVFTTHTPVEAGHDYFPPELMGRYFRDWLEWVGIPWDAFYGLGRTTVQSRTTMFCMTALAIRGSRARNAVSRLHGEVSRAMWQGLFHARRLVDVPIGHVTNGVHLPSWIGPYMSRTYSDWIADDWQLRSGAVDWTRIREVPSVRLWGAHQDERERLVARLRDQLRAQALERGTPADGPAVEPRPDALTITFARRFATYKRATLLLNDRTRLARIVGDAQRPIQFIFAGKAHPRDEAGKQLLRDVFAASQHPDLVGRIFFVENYDIELARYLVRGSDIWLNVPRRPHEASGTSGMKAAANGGLNLSIADGWWAEAWVEHNAWEARIGWVIPEHEYHDQAAQDAADAATLYDLLENEIGPLFHARDVDDLPQSWIAMMRAAIGQLNPFFNTDRMVSEYATSYYRLGIETSSVTG
ncbi:MAG: alpha-glucan family phosphorylase [Gemmatimonadetes bacterium]|nr:alpha-glucan family phosphorylase [Gemmatimonadota bacterium]